MLKEFFKDLKPRDIIALVVVVFGFYLILKGLDGVVGGILIAVVAYYFGRVRNYANQGTNESLPRDGGA